MSSGYGRGITNACQSASEGFSPALGPERSKDRYPHGAIILQVVAHRTSLSAISHAGRDFLRMVLGSGGPKRWGFGGTYNSSVSRGLEFDIIVIM